MDRTRTKHHVCLRFLWIIDRMIGSSRSSGVVCARSFMSCFSLAKQPSKCFPIISITSRFSVLCLYFPNALSLVLHPKAVYSCGPSVAHQRTEWTMILRAAPSNNMNACLLCAVQSRAVSSGSLPTMCYN